MSPVKRFARNHKLRTDRAISDAYAHLATDPAALAAFTELLCCVRSLAPSILAAPCDGGGHRGINVLANLSRWSHAYLRPIADWTQTPEDWRAAIDSLVRHLLARYPTPRFLTSAWSLPGGAENDRQRQWFVTHASGCSFRSMDLPIQMTRRMEDIFLRSPADMGIPYAMRRAELLGLGIPRALVAAVLSTRLATDLRHGDFWRSFWHFLHPNAAEITPAQVGPIIDFLSSVRLEPIVVVSAGGASYSQWPLAPFSMKGRTVASLMQLMQEWNYGCKLGRGGSAWRRSGLRSLAVEASAAASSEVPARWQFVELTSSEQLRAEGQVLRHCVGGYAARCSRGDCHIWSLRLVRDDRARSFVTLEVDPQQRAIVQAKGFGNRHPTSKLWQVIGLWADVEGLRVAV
jgi:hypothetical protein